MPTKDDKPATRGELRATKKDLEAAIAKCATRGELRATKKDLEAAIAKCATRGELRAMKRDLDAAIAGCASKKHLDAAIAGCASKKDLESFAQRIVLKIGEVMDQIQILKEQSATKAEMWNYASAVDKVSKDDELLWNKDLVQDERLRVLEDQGSRHADRISSLEAKTPR